MRFSSGPKILFLTRCLDIGGTQRQLVDLATGLHRAGWNVVVSRLYGGGAFEAPLREAGVHLLNLEKQGRWDVLGCLRRLQTTLAREQPDIVFGTSALYGILLNLARREPDRMRVVWTIPSADMDLSYYDWLARLEFRLGVFCSRFADLIIFNSEAGRDYHVARGYSRRRIAVVRNGVDVERYRPDAKARLDLRAEWGIGPDEILIGHVGRLDPMKDHPNFLRAAAAVCADRRGVRLVCVGDGPVKYREELQALATDLQLRECLLWAGERTDMWRVYPALDLVVSSSLSEGLPNVLVEAMSSGVPCVATDVGDCAAVVGDTGWTCRRGDSAALARAMIQALAALPLDSRPIRERVRTQFNLETWVERMAAQLLRVHAHGASASALTSESAR